MEKPYLKKPKKFLSIILVNIQAFAELNMCIQCASFNQKLKFLVQAVSVIILMFMQSKGLKIFLQKICRGLCSHIPPKSNLMGSSFVSFFLFHQIVHETLDSNCKIMSMLIIIVKIYETLDTVLIMAHVLSSLTFSRPRNSISLFLHYK